MTIKEASDQLKERKISAVELTRAYLGRINALNEKINAYVTVDEQSALKAAEAADARIAKGEATPMTGIPIAHKDLFCTEGVQTTCGSRMLKGFKPPYDATVTTRLKESGAVILGKTNMDEFAMGSSTETSYYGVTRNPWDLERIPGGSSGGSAAAVAAGLCVAATGTDTGGSIRQPAAVTGITGLKPTYGRVSRYGMIAFASSLDQGGPMCRTAEDTAIMLQSIAGHDAKDSTSLNIETPDFSALLNKGIKGLKIGVPTECFGEGLEDDVRSAIDEAKKVFADAGAELVTISLPYTGVAIPTYYIIAPAEASSNLARYDGVKFGYRCENPNDLQDLYSRSRAEGFGSEVKRRIMLGTYVLSSGYYDAYYRRAQKARRLIANDFTKAFESVDAVLTPTTPGTAFKLGEKKDDPVQMYLSDIYTINVNLAGLPGMSLPCGFDGNNLPIGMQLIGKPLDEAGILRIAHTYQKETDWHSKAPDLSGIA
ncbi:MAG: Asp-tRNA(Asn)/Glu-tRNA(Gln) amidotransferase subunit GatA [Magnetococcales bacterium]|nr:Asp-tRNA(Asn)/Glu-tRNA(Gln) amidotransferase subunit GatA [Magnetococcales bacterium]